MYFGARTHSLDEIEFLAQAGFVFAEIDWKAPHFLSTKPVELAMLRAVGYDGGFSFEARLEYVERGRDAIREVWNAALRCDQVLSM